MRLRPRLLTLVACLVALTVAAIPAGALGAGLEDRHEQLESRIAGLRESISDAKEQEGVLSGEIRAASSEIGSLEGQIEVLSAEVAELQADLDAHRARLAVLVEKLDEQTRRLEFLVREHRIALKRLEERLVQLYEADSTSTLEIVLQVGSLSDLIEQIDYFTALGEQDKRIAADLEQLRDEMRVARARTAATKKQVAAVTAELAEKTAEQAAARDQLVAQQNALAAARDDKQGLLSGVREERQAQEEDLEAMHAASASIAAQIQAAQAAAAEAAADSGSGSVGGSSTPSASGFIWPVAGTLTSGFGLRWGRMHEGIDISAPAGTAIHAAAAGQIIFAGSMGGYGNMVIIDHGGGIATAYAHMSSIWIGGGSVSQGASIGGVGTTGSSTGNHLHFEVRVNGAAVDPMGYL